MKALALIFFMVLSGASFADTTASEKIWFDGSVEREVVNLSTEKTRTEYRTVTVPATCYRTEYRYRCHWTPGHCRTDCRRGHCRRVCAPGRQICRNVPVRVPYSCQRQVRQSYEVFDHYVNTEIALNFNLENILNGANEEFSAQVVGKDAGVSVNDSRRYLILKKQVKGQASRDGDTLNQALEYQIDFVSAEVLTETLGNGIQNVSLRNGVLSFALGKHFNTKDFIQNLKIYNARRFGSDILLLDRDISANEMDVSTDGDLKTVGIDLNKLGIALPSRMRVIMNTSFNAKDSKVMNQEAFELEASANWLFSK